MKHTLPKLEYPYDSLEPYIDAKTMKIHHSKHHQGYVDKLNAALENYRDLQKKEVKELLENLDQIPQEARQAVRNNGGGHFNHTLFWQMMTPNSSKEPSGKLKLAIEKAFGTFEEFKEKFSKESTSQFGSGWGWLVIGKDQNLEITTTPNQDNPISAGMEPILTVDVWEHAYYLKYQNKRAEYLENWWNVVNWDFVESMYNNYE